MVVDRRELEPARRRKRPQHARIRKILANELKPEFIKYIEGGTFIPKYVEVVSSTPDEILNKAAAAE